MDYYVSRRVNLLRDCKGDGVDGLLITHPTNVRYLTGFTGSSGAVVLSSKLTILISDARYEEQIKEECKGVDAHIRPHTKTLPDAMAEVLAKSGLKNVGVEADHLSVSGLAGLQEKAAKLTFAPLSGKVEHLRVVKDPSELEQIKTAISVAERAFRMFVALMKETDTEKDLADAMEMYIRRAGGMRSSFAPIVATGERSALPHAVPTSRTVGESSKVLVDWGADVGYKSDLTRTLKSPFPTPPLRKTKDERTAYNFDAVYEAVRQAHEAAVKELRAGAQVKDIDAAARKALTKHSPRGVDLNDHFTHGLGHGIGLETHEAPQIRQNSETVLEVGSVVTIEPGVYLPGWGGVRIEDDYQITKDGAIRLTTLPHDPGAIG
ncbi:MAG: Xaa-Pro peptidase family protein [Fimbriiglobus sp.]|jgi:Xaa-Pro aminopeptidase|nr:Xaa-Pro peptidase family protein [Fimbriiglobus sp.]